MTDCSVVAVVTNATDLVATVTQPTAVAALASATDLVAVASTPSTIVATASEPSALVAVPETPPTLTAVVQELTELVAEIETMSLTPQQLEKLNSIAWGARNYQPDYITLVRATAKGVASGDSDPWVVTSTSGEVVQWLVAHPAWRGSGIMEIDLTAKFVATGTTGGGGYLTVEIQEANDYQTEPQGTPTSTFGLPQAWTTVTSTAFGPLGASTSSHVRVFRFEGQVLHEGNTSTTYSQAAQSQAWWNNPAPTILDTNEFLQRVSIDTSVDKLMRIVVKTDYAPTSTEYFHVVSAYVGLKHPRDKHGY